MAGKECKSPEQDWGVTRGAQGAHLDDDGRVCGEEVCDQVSGEEQRHTSHDADERAEGQQPEEDAAGRGRVTGP